MGKKRGRNRVKKEVSKKGDFWVGGLVIALVIGWFAWSWVSTKGPNRFSNSKLTASGGYIRKETRIPLSPDLFVGRTVMAYQVAHEIPNVLDRLYCYCHCDKHLGHRTLLSCFVDSHAAT